MITTTPRRSRRLLLCGAIALTGLGLTSFTVADAAAPAATPVRSVAVAADNASTDDTATDDTATDDTATDDTATDDTDWAAADTDWVAESNAEQDQLAAYLDDQGIAYTVEQSSDEDGSSWRWVDVDYSDQAASDAVDDFYWSLYPVAQSDIDAANADTDALGAYLEAHGIAVSTSTDRHGFHTVEWNVDDPAAENAVEDFYWALYPTSPEDIAAINTEAEAEVAYLTANGFTASIETDRHGIESSVFDYDDDAVWAALDTYWSTDSYWSNDDSSTDSSGSTPSGD